MKRSVFPLALALFLCAGLPIDSHAGDKDKQKEHKKEKPREDYKFLSPKQREKIRHVRDRYQELPPQQKRQLREKWQKDKREKQKK
ncbi:DUF3106 domain-containing protein [Porticoccus sp. W117]|uniref:DUF3106 domain-containing protein n=1 Tax=Porticoccus sp. W117 TaxID=3054777 RepID=UPI002595AEE7|nr:DUF3106 domain-containing protein [Porticoccus sp. W117]MDM3871961.1 DUF3106 domain-containing protein [Porticoccus sp. W117]